MSTPQEEASRLITVLDDERIQKDVERIKQIDPMQKLRTDLIGFFQNRISQISKQEAFRQKVQDALDELVESRALGFDQLYTLLRGTTSDISNAAESITALFKPVPGSPSPLSPTIDPNQNKAQDEIDRALSSYTPEQLEKLDKLYQIMTKLTPKDGPKS